MLAAIGACLPLLLVAADPVAPQGDGAGPPNPLLAPWLGPHGGAPPFDAVRLEHFAPAFEAAMAAQMAAVEEIAANPAPPTFENTLAALERSGRTLDRVERVFEVWSSALATPGFQALERDLAPRLAAHRDRVAQDQRLYRRVAAVREALERSGADPEQRRLAWLHATRLARAGARLDAAGKKRVAEINERLAGLFTRFSQNLLAEEEVPALIVEQEADLAGLPPAVRAAAAQAAASLGRKGSWAVLDTRSSVEPFLAHSDRRDLREVVWRAFVGRGDHRGPRDNQPLIAEILQLRGERARLLGYRTHAHWRVEDSMAGTPERALALMEAVWPATVARVSEEVADMQAVADREGAKIAIEPWDYRYYAEKVRRERYDLDEAEVRPYLQLERLREALFWVAGKLFGLRFRLAAGVPVYHPDVRAFEVLDRQGKHLGLWFLDPFARPGKQSGAWMEAYRWPGRLDGEVPAIVSNNANFVRGEAGRPVLVSWDDARTLFHEFGHALHGLLSTVRYPSLSGTQVARDYAEFPSQLLERWLATPEVLGRFAIHAGTGRPIPADLVRKIERAARFNQGFITAEYLSAALVDMKVHLAREPAIDPAAFERETLAALGMPREIAMRHRLPQFAHIFSGDDYSAGYYSYLWSDTLSADTFEAFTEAGGPYDKAVAERLRAHVLSAGNTVDPAQAYRAFRGRDAGIAALMRRRGFPTPSAGGSR